MLYLCIFVYYPQIFYSKKLTDESTLKTCQIKKLVFKNAGSRSLE